MKNPYDLDARIAASIREIKKEERRLERAVDAGLEGLPRPLKAAIQRYARARIADSWKGGGDPADVLFIERELVDAARNVGRAWDKVFYADHKPNR